MPADPDARGQFHDLFVEMLPEVRTWLRRQGAGQDVDDLAGETFAVVWARWDDLPAAHSDRRGWVYGVARNKLRGARGRTLHRRSLERPTDRRDPADPASTAESNDFIAQALASLSPAERDAVAMTVLADLPPAQAAKALGCSVSALSTRLSRARVHLHRFLTLDPDPSTPERTP